VRDRGRERVREERGKEGIIVGIKEGRVVEGIEGDREGEIEEGIAADTRRDSLKLNTLGSSGSPVMNTPGSPSVNNSKLTRTSNTVLEKHAEVKNLVQYCLADGQM
jgi:hypothetical protein